MFDIEETKLKGVKILYPKVHYDIRGSFCKIFDADFFYQNDLCQAIQQQFYTKSYRNVIRGLHFQIPPYNQYKLVTCISGRIVDVVVDLRQNSDTYGKYIMVSLTNDLSLYIPPGIAHGFVVRSEETILLYNVDTFSPNHDKGIHYDSLGINWQVDIRKRIISERDINLPKFEDFVTPFVGGKYL